MDFKPHFAKFRQFSAKKNWAVFLGEKFVKSVAKKVDKNYNNWEFFLSIHQCSVSASAEKRFILRLVCALLKFVELLFFLNIERDAGYAVSTAMHVLVR